VSWLLINSQKLYKPPFTDTNAEDAKETKSEEEEEVAEAKPVALLLHVLDKIEEAHSVSCTNLRKNLKRAEAVQVETLTRVATPEAPAHIAPDLGSLGSSDEEKK